MYFRFRFRASGLRLSFRDKDCYEFRFAKPIPTTLSLRSTGDPNRGDVLCDSSCESEPSDKVRGTFENLAAGNVPAGSDLESLRRSNAVDPEGQLRPDGLLPLAALPQPFQSFTDQLWDQQYHLTSQAVGLIRWRVSMPQGHRTVVGSIGEDKYSLDNATWLTLPTRAGFRFEVQTTRLLPDPIRAEITSLVEAGATEPLAHTLYREAWQQRRDNPRSALLIAVAAAEVGFKQFASKLVPDAQWLIANVPSPPLERMLRDFFPQLAAKALACDLKIPPDLVDQIRKSIHKRNELAHRDADLKSETVEETLRVVSDLLWLFDYCSGFPWALQHMSEPTRDSVSAQITQEE